jgi:2-oxoglutarate ferredoxin oxidoreductase subunit beta
MTSTPEAPATTKVVFERPHVFVEEGTPWCQGCGYGAWSRIIVEELERMNPAKLVGTVDVACLEYMREIVPGDMLQALHGRSVSTMRALKLANPEAFAIAFQGDGGMLNEGLNEIIHLAASGDNVCVIFGNNGVLGDTGGQYTFGTPEGLKTATSPQGRNRSDHGSQIPIANILAIFPGTAFVGRISTHDPAYVFRGQKILRKALEANMAGAGFTFIECVTTCPTGWRMTPVESAIYTEEHILDKTPVGIIKDWDPATHVAKEAPLPRLAS